MSTSGESAVQGSAEVDLDRSWRDSAACAGKDPALWFPGRGEFHLTSEAVLTCRTCPVRQECLAHALLHEKYGTWGGVGERQRRRMRRAAGIRLIPLTPVEAEDDWVAAERAAPDDELEEAAGW